MNLNGTEYFYVRNAQGDIIGLVDKEGAQIATYSYDSWGKLISIKGATGADITNNPATVGYKNPYRYRGYRYDSETELYYLQSRYYNPTWSRFINADGITGVHGIVLAHNIFLYCYNDPINKKDDTGFLATQAQDNGGSGGSANSGNNGGNKNTGAEGLGGSISSGNLSQRLREFGRFTKFRLTNGFIAGRDIVGSKFNDIKPTQDVINREKVAEYANKLKSGQDIDPIMIMEIQGKGKYIVEGHHRYVASQQTGISVKVIVTKGNGPVGLPDWSEVKWKEYISEDQFWGD